MSLPFGPPYPVSPLIRGLRYSFLVAGIFYGIIKQKKYEKEEDLWREEEAARKIIRDKEHARLKAKIAKEEKETVKLLESGKLFDVMDNEDNSSESHSSHSSPPKSPFYDECECDVITPKTHSTSRPSKTRNDPCK